MRHYLMQLVRPGELVMEVPRSHYRTLSTAWLGALQLLVHIRMQGCRISAVLWVASAQIIRKPIIPALKSIQAYSRRNQTPVMRVICKAQKHRRTMLPMK